MLYFYTFFAEHPIFAAVQVAFTIWMLVDAYHRGVDYFWYWIILLAPAIGPVAYFFTFKVHDFRNFKGWFQPRISIKELRYRVAQVPTLANQLALGERLIETHEYAEALTHLQAALTREPDHSQVLYCQAVCHVEMDQPQKAIPFLERIMARDRLWSDYAAWRLLIQARSEVGDQEGALQACRDLVKLAPNLRHRCLLAEHLLAHGQKQEARMLLDQGLQDQQFAPGPIRRRNRRWASQARRLLREC
jgi:hypothetical protein